MSDKNIKQLSDNQYKFIIGGRIKNETQAIQQQILSLSLTDGESIVLSKGDRQRLIVSYAASRAKNDEQNRKRGLTRLEKQLQKGKLTKRQINNKGYNKYLKLSGEIKIEIDYDKYKADAKWDGLKGYLTNTTLSKTRSDRLLQTTLEY